MKNGKYVLLNVASPFILGINAASLLIMTANFGDRPGLYIVATVILTGLIFWLVRNIGNLKRSQPAVAVSSFLAGSVGTIYFTLYVLGGGLYEEPPGMIIMGLPLLLSLIFINRIQLAADN